MTSGGKIAFVACLERGALEQQVLLLCRSLRRFGGACRDAPIYTFSPRPEKAVTDETLSILREMGVVHRSEALNTEYADVSYSNKIFTAARAEQLLTEEVLVFVDSDTIFTAEPSDLLLPPHIDAAALPVSNSKLGSTGCGSANDGFWQRLYEICGVQSDWFLETTVDAQRIRPYFNSGLVAVRRSKGLFAQWQADFLNLMKSGHISPSTGVDGMDEFSLAATLARPDGKIRILDLRYNYPLELSMRPMLAPPWRQAQLEDLIHVHYRFWFHRPGYLALLQPPLEPHSSIVRWLSAYLPLSPVVDDAWIEYRRRTPGMNIHQVALR